MELYLKKWKNVLRRRGFQYAIQFSRGVLGFHRQPKAKTVQEGTETLQAGVTSLG
jgi:hypothetical protein